MFSEFQNGLYTSTTKTHESEHDHEDNYEQHQHAMKPLTMQEFSDAIKPTQKRQSCGHERSQRSDDQRLQHNIRLKHTLTYNCTPRPTNSHKQPRPNGRSKVIHMSGTHHHHGTTDPSVRSPSCTKSSASSSSSGYNPHQTPTSPLTKQPSDWAAPRQATCSRSGNSDREPLSGTSRSGSQPSTSKNIATVENSLRMEGLTRSKTSRNNTYSHSRGSTTDSEQRYTRRSKANTSSSSGEPSSEAHSARSCSTHSYSKCIMKPLTDKWNRGNHGVRLVEHDPDTNLSNLWFAEDILLISGSLKHTTTMLDDLTTATTARGLYLHSTKPKFVSNTTSKPRKSNTVEVRGMDIEILPPEVENQIPWPTHHVRKRCPSRVRPPHQMRVDNIHEPQAGVDITKIPTESQTQALRRHGGSITSLRFRDEKETPDNATTGDEDDHADNTKNR